MVIGFVQIMDLYVTSRSPTLRSVSPPLYSEQWLQELVSHRHTVLYHKDHGRLHPRGRGRGVWGTCSRRTIDNSVASASVILGVGILVVILHWGRACLFSSNYSPDGETSSREFFGCRWGGRGGTVFVYFRRLYRNLRLRGNKEAHTYIMCSNQRKSNKHIRSEMAIDLLRVFLQHGLALWRNNHRSQHCRAL